jgi:hypothetical protein
MRSDSCNEASYCCLVVTFGSSKQTLWKSFMLQAPRSVLCEAQWQQFLPRLAGMIWTPASFRHTRNFLRAHCHRYLLDAIMA